MKVGTYTLMTLSPLLLRNMSNSRNLHGRHLAKLKVALFTALISSTFSRLVNGPLKKRLI